MIGLFRTRVGHYLALLIAGILLFFPNLGAHTLWDVDESHNAECAREMMIANDYVVPTFNFVLRSDKPILQYWFIISAYRMFGVTEFAARFWSAMCGLGTILITYELGRRMFDAATGLLSGVILASSIMFCVSAHATTPDAFLILLVAASALVFWWGYTSGSGNWLMLFGITTGLAVLAKGPVGWVLPAAANFLFLVWERRWRLLLDRRLLIGSFLFLLVAGPWYALVAANTKWEFWKGFFLWHNLQRFQTPLDGHRGPFFYHPLALLVAFGPWSCFLGLTVWLGTGRRARRDAPAESERLPAAYRYLWCWIAVWLVVFSAASTKLPNYILPCYAPLALLTARALTRWRTGTIQVPSWLMLAGFGCLAVAGLAAVIAALAVSGHISALRFPGPEMPELAPWALIGVASIAVAAFAGYATLRERRVQALAAVAVGAIACIATVAALGPSTVDRYKTARELALEIARHQREREIQIAWRGLYQPGLVFYCGQKVELLRKDEDAVDHLFSPLQAFLIVPADKWDELAAQVRDSANVIARHWDITTGKEILLVTNRPAVEPHFLAERR